MAWVQTYRIMYKQGIIPHICCTKLSCLKFGIYCVTKRWYKHFDNLIAKLSCGDPRLIWKWLKNLTVIFAKSNISLADKLTNWALVIPTPGRTSIKCISLLWRHNGAIASQITSLTIVYSTVYSDEDQRKLQSSASLAFVWGTHRGPMNSPHKWPVTRKIFPFDDVIMCTWEKSLRFMDTSLVITGSIFTKALILDSTVMGCFLWVLSLLHTLNIYHIFFYFVIYLRY